MSLRSWTHPDQVVFSPTLSVLLHFKSSFLKKTENVQSEIKKVIPGFRKIEVPHIVAEIEPFSAFFSFRCIDAFVLL